MPADDRLRLDNHQHFRPARPNRSEHHPEQSITFAECRRLGRAVQHQQLVSQGEVFQYKLATSLEHGGNTAQDRKNEREHIKPACFVSAYYQRLQARMDFLLPTGVRERVDFPAHLLCCKTTLFLI